MCGLEIEYVLAYSFLSLAQIDDKKLLKWFEPIVVFRLLLRLYDRLGHTIFTQQHGHPHGSLWLRSLDD